MSSSKRSSIDDKSSQSVERHLPIPESTEESRPISTEEWQKIRKQIDLRLMPWLCVTYLIMRIDINNIANAAIMNLEQGTGIKQQLGLSAQDWTWAIACFFYPYMFLEPVSTLLMKRTTPSFWIGRIMIVWGVVVMCIGAVKNYAGLIATRTLLGAAEAGYYPCVIYYLAFWFPPEELALRIAVFYSFGQVSGFVGGFLAFAISYMNGLGGLSGWRWLFIIEGIPAVLMGVATLFIMPDYPQTAKFLTLQEREYVASRLSKDAPTKSANTWDTKQAIELFKDPSFWSFTAVWFCHAVGGFGLGYVLPTVIYELGFTTTAIANVLSMPPTACTFIVLNLLGYLVQKKGWNPYRVAIGLELTNIVCCILQLTVKVTVVKYLSLIVATATAGSVYPILWPNRVKAARGTTGAGLAIGFTNATAQFSGILGPQVFSTVYGPTYKVSFIVCAGLLGGAIVSIALSGLLTGELWKRGTSKNIDGQV
ncbi:phthalate transporter [Moniliophthora roreri MCA 2997]|uniref:Phthalate transporter n=1 Tax=Moniliophthora roreri (strain MCA 2997) TaxID=1381753 RepID=V2XKD2_MONRO|nr:phthalate transporter [Moniliophthora roreri MCA 2997]